jgi:hypothetical protein
MLREVVQEKEFARSGGESSRSAAFYRSDCLPLPLKPGLDLDRVAREIGFRQPKGKLRPADWSDQRDQEKDQETGDTLHEGAMQLPTPAQLKELLLEVCRRYACALNLEQARALAIGVFGLGPGEGPPPPPPPPPQQPDDAIDLAADKLIRAIEAADKRPIDQSHPEPKKERRRLGRLLTKYALWWKYPVKAEFAGASGEYTLEVYARLLGLGEKYQTTHDRFTKKLAPLFAWALAEAGLIQPGGAPATNDFVALVNLLQNQFYHLKPEFVDDTHFHED